MQCPSISLSYGIVGTSCPWIREETSVAAITILRAIFDAFVSYRMRQAAAQAEQARPRASSQSICAP
jgi:hypothetical protein